MSLTGNLEDLPLLDIIQIVSFSKKTGSLGITTSMGEGAIVFREGFVVASFAWDAPPVDPGHDAATLYRIARGPDPQGSLAEVGSATSTAWVDVDALHSPDSYYYLVDAENSGGGE